MGNAIQGRGRPCRQVLKLHLPHFARVLWELGQRRAATSLKNFFSWNWFS